MEAFKKHLKRRGKKKHVADALVSHVEQFSQYLKQRGLELESAATDDLAAFAADLESVQKGAAKKVVRGIALYYNLVGNDAMAALARKIREEATAKTRKAFVLKNLSGVNQKHTDKLAAEGIVNVEHMITAGKTESLRLKLAEETGIPQESILELVKLSDLARLPGVKGIRARLYHDAGVDTVEKMAHWEPEALRTMVADFVERTNFDGIAPLPKEASSTVATAKKLPKLVEY